MVRGLLRGALQDLGDHVLRRAEFRRNGGLHALIERPEVGMSRTDALFIFGYTKKLRGIVRHRSCKGDSTDLEKDTTRPKALNPECANLQLQAI